MAIIKSIFKFEGKLEGMNAYLPKNRDESEGYILRTNGGPTRKQIEKLPSCELVRQNNHEFGTSSAAAKAVRMAIRPVSHLADINLASQFTSLCRHMLKQDKKNKRGERMVFFSEFGYLMSGVNLNKNHLFDSVVRNPVSATLDHDTATAEIRFPALQPDVNLVLPWQRPLFRFIISLGVAGNYRSQEPPVSYNTEWYSSQQAVEAQTVTLQLSNNKFSEYQCMVVAVGVEMGMVVSDALVESVKHIGCGKVLIAG
ncbi:hypothetical protein [[Flexibacter] sp. ATCC 35208]|uniref:hypothetical protein n=1 Tax=[Flexibacter] sp. ATCC 35208 TaxID=1936242 RepID=UPI0009D4451A|nr:hypothetical protein [[Flexibacter] sp. ATCC 35208]OMP78058.1 hypothetical protein BW716_16645 [[Flexibacter] sp. ATCC 35208]